MACCSYIAFAMCCAVLVSAQDMRLVFENCKKYNPLPTDPVRLAALKLSESFEQNWISSGLCAEVQRAKRATAGIAAPKFEPEEYDGAGQPPRNTNSHRSADQQQRVQVSRAVPSGCHGSGARVPLLHVQCLYRLSVRWGLPLPHVQCKCNSSHFCSSNSAAHARFGAQIGEQHTRQSPQNGRSSAKLVHRHIDYHATAGGAPAESNCHKIGQLT
jgi:hypothetical protein